MIFSVLTLFSALSISVIAAYFSIIGLATIFPGSIEAVIAMGAALEIGKIVAAIWLHKNWKTAPKMLRIYLFGAIVVLMGITSMGIFGFLSKSHIEHEQHAVKAAALVEQVENKIDREQEYIARQKELIQQNEDKNQNRSDKSAENIELEQNKITQLTEQLEKDIELDQKMLAPIAERIKQMNDDLAEVQNKPGGIFSNKKKDIENKIAEQAAEREELAIKKKGIEDRISKYRDETSALISDIRKRIQEYQNIGFEKPENVEQKIEQLNKNIASALDRIDELERQKFDFDDGSRQLEAEVGPIKYVAELIADFTGMQFDIGKAARIVIIILIFVFDPLAVLLVLAAHISLSKRFPKLTQDESIMFEKIAEIEAQNKKIEKDQSDLEERKKDIDQENKLLDLQESQVKKYQEEISSTKETLRQLKLETQKKLLEQEDTSSISIEMEKLIQQKSLVEKEIKEIKLKKSRILERAEETINSAKEIKRVFGDHKENKDRIEKLKSEICINLEEFKKFKNTISALESRVSSLNKDKQTVESKNKELLDEVADLKTSSKQLEALEKQKQEIENELNSIKKELKTTKEKGQKLESELALSKSIHENCEAKIQELQSRISVYEQENSKQLEAQENTKIIKVKNFPNNSKVCVECKSGGFHSFCRPIPFEEQEINQLISISSQIDQESNQSNTFSDLFERHIKELLDPRLSNREFNLKKPKYQFEP